MFRAPHFPLEVRLFRTANNLLSCVDKQSVVSVWLRRGSYVHILGAIAGGIEPVFALSPLNAARGVFQ